MAKAQLVATKAFRYAGRALVIGDAFEAGARDAKLLMAIGKAKDAPPAPASAHDGDTAEDQPKRGRYTRRDVRAED